MSAEKASLSEFTCWWTSGIGNTGAHCSKMRMWRTKKSRASLLSSGSGEVIEACEGRVSFLFFFIWYDIAYQVHHCACQNTIDCEAHAALHTKHARKSEILQDALLNPTHPFCSVMANDHVPLPTVPICHVLQRMNLRPVMHDGAEVMIAMHVGHKSVW